MNPRDTHHILPHQNPLYLKPIQIGNIHLRPIDLLEHVLATGATGTGKTRSFICPFIMSVLRHFGLEPSSKAGMILIDAKGDMAELASECARRVGRENDVLILGEGGNCWYALFEQFSGDPTAIANFLYGTLEDRSSSSLSHNGGSNDSFWDENARRMLRSAVILAKARHGDSMGGLQGIADGIDSIISAQQSTGDDSVCDQTESSEMILNDIKVACEEYRITGDELTMLKNYIERDVMDGNRNTWATIANMARNYIAQFSQPALQRLFKPSPGKIRVGPEDVIDKGLILIVSLSPVICGEAAAPFRMAVKKGFCERVLQRTHLCTFENEVQRPINQDRPILYVCDEFHTTLNANGPSADAYFLDRAREFRCMCVLASQGISAIQSVIGSQSMCDHLLNNCRTKFFFANDCPQTSRYFESLGGEDERMVESITLVPRKAPPRFRLPNHHFTACPSVEVSHQSSNPRHGPRFSASKLGSLPNGSALVVTKGRMLEPYTMNPINYDS
jgi:hypothetical protein